MTELIFAIIGAFVSVLWLILITLALVAVIRECKQSRHAAGPPAWTACVDRRGSARGLWAVGASNPGDHFDGGDAA